MKRLVRRLNRPGFRGAALGLLCGLLCWMVSLHPLIRGLEEWFQDGCFVNRGNRRSDTRVVVVQLDDASLAELPKPLVFLSPELSEVVEDLSRRGASAIGLDLMIPEDLDHFPGLEADRLGVAAARTDRVVMPVFDLGDRLIRPLQAWRAGRRSWAWSPSRPMTTTSSAVSSSPNRSAARTTINSPSPCSRWRAASTTSGPTAGSEFDGRVVHDDGQGRLRVNFVGPAGTIDHIPFRVALAAARGGPPPSVDVRGAIVILGSAAEYLGDFHVTPYANGTLLSLWTRPNGLMSGPEFQANVVATLADGAFIITPGWLGTPIVVPAIGMVLGAIFARLSLTRGAVLAAAHHIGWKLAALLGLWLVSWRIEMVAMLLTGATCYSVTFALRWRWLRRMFGVMRSRDVLRALEDDPDNLQREGQDRVLTVLFADIRNFTAFSEGRSPRRIVALLNEYFGAVVPIVEDHGGAIDKYIGDGLMVLFGALEISRTTLSRRSAPRSRWSSGFTTWKRGGSSTSSEGCGLAWGSTPGRRSWASSAARGDWTTRLTGTPSIRPRGSRPKPSPWKPRS